MARPLPEDDLTAIVAALGGQAEACSAQQILQSLASPPPLRTLQYRLRLLVDQGRLLRQGEGRWARYRLPALIPPPAASAPYAQPTSPVQVPAHLAAEPAPPATVELPLSAAAQAVRDQVRQPLQRRQPVGYRREFLESYRPGQSFYLTASERAHLRQVGQPGIAPQPAGTYARQILNRLLIDLAWNSSRLEGNTYSLLDTRRLIELGEEAPGRGQLEAQMILNHKDAIEFLVGQSEDIGFNRYTLLNLHAMLANNLLADPLAAGRLRYIAVGIEGSTFHPLEVPFLIEECFDQILATAAAIADPYEQALFVMVQLPYLQPFDDVNKRVSRLAANIPLIHANLAPLAFTDLPRELYTEATLSVYEQNSTALLKEVFIWACERSAARYAAVRQSLVEPDPFRMRHRLALRELVGELVRSGVRKTEAAARIAGWSAAHVAPEDQAMFNQVVEIELASLHEGNFARYAIRPSAFKAWQNAWRAA
ncbi:Fic family protein [Ideonella azotifigens]|uniref:Fido domain-containing protein n=3 Tax=Ideonella azotifigens TaxID=513160 RepID=A0ABN1KAW5_9BURK|nr:Fic family protein [Ideonella azotifigens]MCD2338899.1 Fic family protein [Ideonella azotifigens]